jgi:hypothetical protein
VLLLEYIGVVAFDQKHVLFHRNVFASALGLSLSPGPRARQATRNASTFILKRENKRFSSKNFCVWRGLILLFAHCLLPVAHCLLPGVIDAGCPSYPGTGPAGSAAGTSAAGCLPCAFRTGRAAGASYCTAKAKKQQWVTGGRAGGATAERAAGASWQELHLLAVPFRGLSERRHAVVLAQAPGVYLRARRSSSSAWLL